MINWNAIAFTPLVLLQPRLLVPQSVVAHLDEIDTAQLARDGITGVLIDYDDTLAWSASGEPMPGSIGFAERCRTTWGDRACVFSDSAGTPRDHDGRLVRVVLRRFGLPTLSHRSDKPGGIDAVRERFGSHTGRFAIVGDRLLTDVVFGNRHGLATIWLRHERPIGAFASLERRVLERLKA